MISFLRGIPAAFGPDYVVLDVNGVGYKVFVPTQVIGVLADKKSEVTVYTYLHLREDAMQLFGCLSEKELELFEMLIQVSGIGPKGALAVLSAMTVSSFVQAVINDDVRLLTGIPGIGKKTAQRIVIELKDKLAKADIDIPQEGRAPGVTPLPAVENEALQALIALGYSPAEAKRALGKISAREQGSLNLEETVKLALKELAGL